MAASSPTTIEEYIATFPEFIQEKLQDMRIIIGENAPDAKETISYAIPTFKLKGKILVHFAAFQHHIGFYALPTGHVAFEKDFSVYKTGKGSVQFPLGQALPRQLIAKVVQFRVNEVIAQLNTKK